MCVNVLNMVRKAFITPNLPKPRIAKAKAPAEFHRRNICFVAHYPLYLLYTLLALVFLPFISLSVNIKGIRQIANQ